MTSCYVTSGNEVWQFGGLISQHFRTPKNSFFFQYFTKGTACLQNLFYKIYREWPNLNTVKILFCKVAVPLVKFAIKDLKTTEKRQNKATLPIFSTL